MLAVTGVVLKTPTLQYNSEVSVRNPGAWNLAGNVKFNKAASLPDGLGKVGCLIIQAFPTAEELDPPPMQFMQRLAEELRRYGMTWPQAEPAEITLRQTDHENTARLNEAFSKAKKDGIVFLIVVLPSHDTEGYSRVKFYGDIKY